MFSTTINFWDLSWTTASLPAVLTPIQFLKLPFITTMAPIPTLQPIQASISDFSGMIANRQETLTMKGAWRHVTRPSVDVIYQTGDGPGQLLMRCDKKNDGSYTVRSSTNELICTIRKERKVSGGRLRRYFRAYAPGSKDALWELCWEEHHFSRDVFGMFYDIYHND